MLPDLGVLFHLGILLGWTGHGSKILAAPLTFPKRLKCLTEVEPFRCVKTLYLMIDLLWLPLVGVSIWVDRREFSH